MFMDGDGARVVGVETGRCPRCELCGRVVRTRGVGRVGVWCVACLAGVLPFGQIVSDVDYRGALREYREGLGSRAGNTPGGIIPSPSCSIISGLPAWNWQRRS